MRLNSLTNVNTNLARHKRLTATHADRLRDSKPGTLQSSPTPQGGSTPKAPLQKAPAPSPSNGSNAPNPGVGFVLPEGNGQGFIIGGTPSDVVKFLSDNGGKKTTTAPTPRPGKTGAAWTVADSLAKLGRVERQLVTFGLNDPNTKVAYQAAALKGPKALQAFVIDAFTNPA